MKSSRKDTESRVRVNKENRRKRMISKINNVWKI